MKNGFGYAIDYAASIANDDAEIALYADGGLADKAAQAWDVVAPLWQTGWHKPGMANLLLSFIVMFDLATIRRVIAPLGIEERAVLAGAYLDSGFAGATTPNPEVAALITHDHFPNYGEATQLAAALDNLSGVPLMTTEQRKAALKRAKANRARHARNSK